MEEIINIENNKVRSLFDDSITKLRLTNDTLSKSYVFDNQIDTAKDIIYNFYTKESRWCLLFAEMQSGKSGTFFSIPYIISRNNTLIKELNIDMFENEINVFLLTGMNEKELISQFEQDIVKFTGMEITKNVLHNSEMRKFLSRNESDWNSSDKVVINRMRKNSLILIDESHYGSDKNQILDKFMKNVIKINPNGDNKELIDNNIYVVSISATPMAEFINANISEFKKKIVPLKNADGYLGISNMFLTNKIFHSYDLKTNLSIDKMLDVITNINKDGYILIRCPKKQQDMIRNRIGDRLLSNFSNPIDYDQYSKSTILDNMGINEVLDEVPNKKQIIFLKGLLRAGKRVNTQNIIMIHDTSESKVDTTVQSLLGRCCGYGKNKDILIYCDRTSAEKYKNWVESSYSLDMIPDKSKNIKGTNKPEASIKTFRNPIEFDVSNNTFIIESMSKRADSGKASIRNINILRSLNNDVINDILNTGKMSVDYDIGTIFNVDIERHNKWINSGKLNDKGIQYTSYQKQYADVLNNNSFFSDYKPDETEIGKVIFSAAYEINTKNLLVSFGKVVKSSITSSDKSMYHQTNNLNI